MWGRHGTEDAPLHAEVANANHLDLATLVDLLHVHSCLVESRLINDNVFIAFELAVWVQVTRIVFVVDISEGLRQVHQSLQEHVQLIQSEPLYRDIPGHSNQSHIVERLLIRLGGCGMERGRAVRPLHERR